MCFVLFISPSQVGEVKQPTNLEYLDTKRYGWANATCGNEIERSASYPAKAEVVSVGA